MLKKLRLIGLPIIINAACAVFLVAAQQPSLKSINTFLAAAQSGNVRVVHALLQRMPDLRYASDVWGCTAIHQAVMSRSLPVVKYLISAYKCLDQTNMVAGITPLWIAAQKNFVDIARFLLSNGADANVMNRVGRYTALHWAAYHGATDLIGLLVRNGAVVNCSDVKGITPLHIAARKGHLEAVKLLVRFGADVNIRDQQGEISLHKAISSGSFPTVQFIVKNGADLHAKAHLTENTPLSWASLKVAVSQSRILRYLVANRSPVDRDSRIMLSTLKINWPRERPRHENAQIQALSVHMGTMPAGVARCILDYVRGEEFRVPEQTRSRMFDQRPAKRRKHVQ